MDVTLGLLLWWALVYGIFPIALGSLVGLPFWLRGRVILGNALGSAAIAIVMTVFILQFLFGTLTTTSVFETEAWLLPLGALVFAGWLDVLIMFFLSGAVEQRVSRRAVRPEEV
ncbi:MAG: hypothetical protein NZL91_10390 [Thermoflexales bacterium]|nr:hypothetical protein [Thermoflexales bacterium]MCS7325525.1 hypothetical protein [Thermoflexales bacterium]MCX7940065.1 hypothetical protein [Thermoflexales bacterium]MDW8053967.1 hypothetical protein [Anaerolineae bacterium]MDW8293089.1 hypothetical protein [Anaerolineae bacterium]